MKWLPLEISLKMTGTDISTIMCMKRNINGPMWLSCLEIKCAGCNCWFYSAFHTPIHLFFSWKSVHESQNNVKLENNIYNSLTLKTRHLDHITRFYTKTMLKLVIICQQRVTYDDEMTWKIFECKFISTRLNINANITYIGSWWSTLKSPGTSVYFYVNASLEYFISVANLIFFLLPLWCVNGIVWVRIDWLL